MAQALSNVFLSWTPDTLKRYFETAVDAENALLLRKSALLIDIGICLETLTANLSIYDNDNAILSHVKDDIETLKHICAERQLEYDYASLANLRSMAPPYRLSFREEHQNLYWEVRPHSTRHRDATAAASKYLEDPLALREYRLGKVSGAARLNLS